MIKCTRLYKGKDKIGDYETAEQIFREVERLEGLTEPLTCLCHLEKHGYRHVLVVSLNGK